MPTRERRPRRRIKAREGIDVDIESLQEEARNATPEVWDDGLRRRFVRGLVEKKGLKPDAAAGIARAFEKRPELIPMRPPSQ